MTPTVVLWAIFYFLVVITPFNPLLRNPGAPTFWLAALTAFGGVLMSWTFANSRIDTLAPPREPPPDSH